MINRFEQFSFLISSINRDIQIIERNEMEKYGCKGAYAQYLIALKYSNGGLTAVKLCEICGKDKAAVSRIITEMELKGLVKKYNDTKTYKSKIKLTDLGNKAAEFVCDKAKSAVNAVGSSLSEEERKQMYYSLEIIAENLRKITVIGIPKEQKRG